MSTANLLNRNLENIKENKNRNILDALKLKIWLWFCVFSLLIQIFFWSFIFFLKKIVIYCDKKNEKFISNQTQQFSGKSKNWPVAIILSENELENIYWQNNEGICREHIFAWSCQIRIENFFFALRGGFRFYHEGIKILLPNNNSNNSNLSATLNYTWFNFKLSMYL